MQPPRKPDRLGETGELIVEPSTTFPFVLRDEGLRLQFSFFCPEREGEREARKRTDKPTDDDGGRKRRGRGRRRNGPGIKLARTRERAGEGGGTLFK